MNVYGEKPKIFLVKGLEHKIYNLRKALYKLKQVLQGWYSKIDSYFAKNDFHMSANEPILNIKSYGNDFFVVCLYIDGMVYRRNSIEMMNAFRNSIMNAFEMIDLGLLYYFQGNEVVQNKDGIFIGPKKCAANFLKKFGMSNCKTAKTPFDINDKFFMNDGVEKIDEKHIRNLVEGLMYLTYIRTNIMLTMSVIFRFMHNPSKHRHGATKKILRYMQRTIKDGIRYVKGKSNDLLAFTNIDWASCVVDRKSITGYIFCLWFGVV